jgi:hypothetical protein
MWYCADLSAPLADSFKHREDTFLDKQEKLFL